MLAPHADRTGAVFLGGWDRRADGTHKGVKITIWGSRSFYIIQAVASTRMWNILETRMLPGGFVLRSTGPGRYIIFSLIKFQVECIQNHVWGPLGVRVMTIFADLRGPLAGLSRTFADLRGLARTFADLRGP